MADDQGAKNSPILEDPRESHALLVAYGQMLIWLFLSTVTVIIVILIPLLIYTFFHNPNGLENKPPPLLFLSLAGCLGAFFSALIRLYNFADLPKALVLKDLQGMPPLHLLIYSLVPAIVGGISACVLYIFFSTGIVSNTIVPGFACKAPAVPPASPRCDSFLNYMRFFSPKDATDYGKAFIWSFIAGFAERLVPDTLNNLSRSLHGGGSEGNRRNSRAS